MKMGELKQALRSADAAAVLVAPRVLDRVIQQVGDLPHLVWQVPHRQCFVVDRHILFRHVEQDELDLDPEQLLPPTVILLARPPAESLSDEERDDILLKYWRLLFHASVHAALEQRRGPDKLTADEVRERVEAIGRVEFEEVRTVLVQENYLLPNADEAALYIEFAAVYLELKHFAANLLPVYFPGIHNFEKIDRLLDRDVDAEALFARTRLSGAPAPVLRIDNRSDESYAYFWKLVNAAEREAKAGNTVRAAVLRTRAARVAPAALTRSTRAAAEADLQQLTWRLQAALQLSDSEAAEWLKDLPPLLDKADQGSRPVEAAVLFDLQTVCLDHEREVYALDLVEWLRSAGRRPIKRPLPSQRLVRINKHLRSAYQRLAAARLADSDRQHLARLLQTALGHNSERLRARFRPVLSDALMDVGLSPGNPPEHTAFLKMVEELLDRIADYGFLTFSDLRDALSRNQLKLPDLADPQEFIRGDPLLRLDRRLSTMLDGVYRPSEIYMRWLERLTALNFGTATGRAITRYVTIPFGGAFVIQEVLGLVLEKLGVLGAPPPPALGATHLIAQGIAAQGMAPGAAPLAPLAHVIAATGVTVSPWFAVLPAIVHVLIFLLLGFFFLGLMHVEAFRRRLREFGSATYRGLHTVCVDWPARVLPFETFKAAVATWTFQLFYWYLCKPLAVCALIWIWYPEAFLSPLAAVCIFVTAGFLVNSRLGQAVGDTVVQAFVRFYELLRAGLLPGLFRLIVSAFKEVVERIEYVLFTVDEWLRFRGGDSELSMIVRTILGLLWFPVSYVARFYIVVLIEPGLNPIKFPVSSVAAKFIYPLLLAIRPDVMESVTRYLGSYLAIFVVYPTFFFLPDVFGFLFWEMKENWSLYRANRSRTLRPVLIGAHGETLGRLLQPGFHSGTIPRLYARLRLAEREAVESSDWRASRACRHALQGIEQAVRQFVDREMLALLRLSPGWQAQPIGVGRVALACNRINIELTHAEHAGQPVWVEFEERQGWLIAGVASPGWLGALPSELLRAFATALAALYKLAGVDLVVQQIQARLPTSAAGFDVTAKGLLLWTDHRHGRGVGYDLRDQQGPVEPQYADGAGGTNWPALDAGRLVFGRAPLYWEEWADRWQQDRDGRGQAAPFGPSQEILPPLVPVPAGGNGARGGRAPPPARPETEPAAHAADG